MNELLNNTEKAKSKKLHIEVTKEYEVPEQNHCGIVDKRILKEACNAYNGINKWCKAFEVNIIDRQKCKKCLELSDKAKEMIDLFHVESNI